MRKPAGLIGSMTSVTAFQSSDEHTSRLGDQKIHADEKLLFPVIYKYYTSPAHLGILLYISNWHLHHSLAFFSIMSVRCNLFLLTFYTYQTP